MKINIFENSYSLENNDKLNLKLSKCVERCVKELRQKGRILLINFEYLNDQEIKKINKKERNVDDATDVLSFPLLNLKPNQKVRKKDFLTDFDLENKCINLGDVFINLKRAKEQAEKFGHSFEREVCYLAVHGTLHLFGFDHETEQDKKIMRALEEFVLSKNKLKR